MNRAEFEARLLRDPELRQMMEKVETAAKRLRRAQEEVVTMGTIRDFGIALLANEGVPLAAIARLVDLTPQRLGVIVHSINDRMTEEEMNEALEQSVTDEDRARYDKDVASAERSIRQNRRRRSRSQSEKSPR
jgi:hypothetical protein